jgi:putative transcriptional regulator
MGNAHFTSMDNLLASYVAGALPVPLHSLVSAHLELKNDNRGFVAGLEDLAGSEMEHQDVIGLHERDARLAAIFEAGDGVATAPRRSAEDNVLPSALAGLVPYTSDNIPWRTKMPGYKECSLGVVDGCEVNLLWIRPGRKMPDHTHEGSEITLVLDGAFSDANGRYARGDIALADEDVDHSPVAENDRPCICLAITDAPLRLTGSYRQIFSDFIGR